MDIRSCLFGACVVALGFASPVRAQDAQRGAIATLVTETGTVVRREALGKPWQVIKQKDKINSDELLIGFSGAQVSTADNAVRVTFLSDLDRSSPYPIVETAVMLNKPSGVDLDVTLDRGRVDIENTKKDGTVRVRVRVQKEAWEFTLDKGANVALELFGRWAAGVHFNKDAKAKETPTLSLVILVTDGQVNVKHGAYEYAMSAPPGPAMIEWDNTTGFDSAPRRLEKLPSWAVTSPETEAGKTRKAVLDRFRKAITEKSVPDALDAFVASSNPADRALAVVAMGAFDDLPRLANALREAKHLDVWDNGVVALRHWIGRGPGQDQLLFKEMTDNGRFNPIEAETILQLLHSYGDADLTRPETYDTLIAYLNHDKLAIRGLAHWHLFRLVPDGKDTGYNPMDSKEKRAAAIEKWRKVIPPGTVPNRPKVK